MATVDRAASPAPEAAESQLGENAGIIATGPPGKASTPQRKRAPLGDRNAADSPPARDAVPLGEEAAPGDEPALELDDTVRKPRASRRRTSVFSVDEEYVGAVHQGVGEGQSRGLGRARTPPHTEARACGRRPLSSALAQHPQHGSAAAPRPHRCPPQRETQAAGRHG